MIHRLTCTTNMYRQKVVLSGSYEQTGSFLDGKK